MVLEVKRANRVVVGLFTQRSDAYRALEELREAAFLPQEIGAAFRSQREEDWFPGTVEQQEAQDLVRKQQNAYSGPGVTGVGSGAAGSASGTNAVTPAGLSTGAGTTTSGAERPGPIPGSDIPHHRKGGATPVSVSGGNPPAAGISVSENPSSSPSANPSTFSSEKRDWWAKVRDFFTSQEEKKRQNEGLTKDDVDYGTGTGHLPLQSAAPASGTRGWSDHAFRYETGSFRSLLMDLGLEDNAAQYFSRLLPPGGAIITVRTASRTNEAELILEGNSGRVRVELGEPQQVDLGEQYDDTDRLAVFGAAQFVSERTPTDRNSTAANLEGFPERVGSLRKPA